LLVIAGAGTGKTSTLAHRVAHLLLEGVAPERLLLLTFSRRAALEMTRRAQRVSRRRWRRREVGSGAAGQPAAAVVRHLPRDRQSPDPRVRARGSGSTRPSACSTAPTPRT
jgi:superfamily I DNA/RNA helicase